MKRSEKIELIKSGKYIIENDMQGSEEANKLLISINNKYSWGPGWKVYGIFTLTNNFTFLNSRQLNDRPRFKMSELVELEEPKEVFTVEMIHALREFYWSNSLEEIATKLNQMAFDAYKTKER